MRTRVSLLLVLLLIVFALPVGVLGKILYAENDDILVAKEEIVQDDLFIAAERVEILGTVNGDVFAAGGEVIVNGTVNGNVYAAGGMISIAGKITQDLVLASGTVEVDEANVGGSLIIGAGTVDLDNKTTIAGGVLFGAGTFASDAQVGRNLIGGAGMVNIDGSIGRDVLLGVGQLVFKSNAKVSGTVTYYAEEDARIDSGAKLTGKVEKILTDYNEPEMAGDMQAVFGGFVVTMAIWGYLSMLLTGALGIYFFNRISKNLVLSVEAKPLRAFGWGFLVLMLVLPVFFMLIFTVIGIQLAFGMLAVLGLASYLGTLLAGWVVGRYMLRVSNFNVQNDYVVFAIGLLILVLIRFVPFVGWLLWFVLVLMGLGAIVESLWNYIKGQRAGTDQTSSINQNLVPPTKEPVTFG